MENLSRIGQILVDWGYLSADPVDEASRKQGAYPEFKLGEILVGI